MKNKEKQNAYKTFIGMTRELFAQTKIVGLIYTALAVIISISIAMEMLIDHSGLTMDYPLNAMIPLAPTMYLSFACSMLVTISAFKYLHSKKSTDFFMSLPISRTNLYFSTCSASMLWVMVANISSAIVGYSMLAPIYAKHGVNMPGRWFEMIIVILIMIASGIAIGAFASSFTGTGGTSLLAAVSVTVLPLIFCTRVENILKYDFYYRKENVFSWLRKNTVYSYVFTNEWGALAYLYTAFLASGLLLLGLWMFNRRKSEISQNGIPNTLVHVILRSCVPLFIFWGVGSIELFEFGAYMIAFLFYISYDLVQTKKATALLTASLWFLLTIAIGYLPRYVAYIVHLIG